MPRTRWPSRVSSFIGILERNSPQFGIWMLGEEGRLLLNVSEDTIDESGR